MENKHFCWGYSQNLHGFPGIFHCHQLCVQQCVLESLKCGAAFGVESTEPSYPSKKIQEEFGSWNSGDSWIQDHTRWHRRKSFHLNSDPPKKDGRRLIEDWWCFFWSVCVFDLQYCIGFRWLRNVSAQHAEIWMGFDDCDGWRFDPRATTVAWRVGASPFSKMTTCTTIQRSAAARRWKVTQTIPARIHATDVWGSCRELVHPRDCSITLLEEKNRFQGLRDESPVDSPSCEALTNTMQMGACLQGLKLGKYLSVRLFVCVDKMKECTIYLSIYLSIYVYISNSQPWTVTQHIFAWSPQGIYLMVSVFVSLSCPLGEDYLVWRNCHGYQLQAGPLKISGWLFPWRFRPWSGCEEGGTVRWWTCPLQKIHQALERFHTQVH